MEKCKNESSWIELGYAIFAEEGLCGLQVERLARTLQLNKSGFYHYFGHMEAFSEEIIEYHDKMLVQFLYDVSQVKQLDPDYLFVLIRHARTVMFQIQLKRQKDNTLFYRAGEAVDHKVMIAVKGIWCEFLGISNNPDIALRYFAIVRDMFYMRASSKNLNYQFLHEMAEEVKQMVNELASNQLVTRKRDRNFQLGCSDFGLN